MRKPTRRMRVTRAPQYTERFNILFTQEQVVKLREWAREDGRPAPNLIRWIIDQALRQRDQELRRRT